MATKEDIIKILVKQFTSAIESVYTDARVQVITFTITNNSVTDKGWQKKGE